VIQRLVEAGQQERAIEVARTVQAPVYRSHALAAAAGGKPSDPGRCLAREALDLLPPPTKDLDAKRPSRRWRRRW
jgi:hypothetical protein